MLFSIRSNVVQGTCTPRFFFVILVMTFFGVLEAKDKGCIDDNWSDVVTDDFGLSALSIKSMLDDLSEKHDEIRIAIQAEGYPETKRREASFSSLLRIMVGQQLSVKAAASISNKLHIAMKEHANKEDINDDEMPRILLEMSEETLRGAGLSNQKVRYARAISSAVLNNELDPSTLHTHSDEEVIKKITAVKGYGRWSAQMFLIFSLGRTDVWPSGDLGVRSGLQKILGHAEDLKKKQKLVEEIGKGFAPYRSVVALMAWKYARLRPPL
eukprot:gnl/MRDRNA2_/MRDRNA2_151613_c0_seq1.p1 gnl/MRDRNA2_/MRDRNA2_151613_c0~~gnl/MRDRNA2_/MRDRNA2_151613_c0_seq1.p1  ORF type:complete len:269 (-),score=47.27 gnl/MRDRNA2_/MRDRNA2_151613_c0_seq1:237-1043(-)